MNIDGFKYAASSGGDVPPRNIIPALAKLRSMEGEGISPRSNPIDLNHPANLRKNEIKKKALVCGRMSLYVFIPLHIYIYIYI